MFGYGVPSLWLTINLRDQIDYGIVHRWSNAGSDSVGFTGDNGRSVTGSTTSIDRDVISRVRNIMFRNLHTFLVLPTVFVFLEAQGRGPGHLIWFCVPHHSRGSGLTSSGSAGLER
jgi:hypothetical protein